LSQSCRMSGLGNNGFPRMEGTIPLCGATHGEVAHPHIDANHAGMRFGCGVSYLERDGNEQVKPLLGLVVPELGRADLRSLLNEGYMLVVAGVGNHHT